MAAQYQGDDQARFSGAHESALTRISIDEALEQNWLDIWYQPKIDLRRKCLAGAEAIVRMQHPQAGFLWPEDYIDQLDDDGLKKLFEHTMLTTLRHWTVFSDAGFNLRLAVKVPAVLLPKLPISALVAEHRPASDKWPGVVLGVTEDQLVRDITATRKIAEELKACGVAVAIDDFGAGYSSFSSLRGSAVRGIENTPLLYQELRRGFDQCRNLPDCNRFGASVWQPGRRQRHRHDC